ncbi:MAG: hypothetical protein V4568_14585 [Pseudomonadota bacterium]
MKYLLEFELKGLPPMSNVASGASRNWNTSARKTKFWKTQVGIVVMGKKPVEPLKKARLVLIRHSSVEPDYDGLVSGFKAVIDGLRKYGVLANDKMQNIGRPEYLWVSTTPKMGKITVKVESIEEIEGKS